MPRTNIVKYNLQPMLKQFDNLYNEQLGNFFVWVF